eukprot:INCI4087.1.p1 GENE.INCI4087.1~~INCI4087.1.p1  ORF type:complete len:311 (+),score=57.37 INCI4087.1:212-1144(+)
MPMLGTRRRSRSRKMPLVSFFIAGLLFFLAVATAEGSEASLQLLWSTPFYKSRVKPSALNGKGLAELERLVLQDYAGFRDSVWAADCGGDNVCVADRRKSGALADRPNEKFFQYQREAFEARQANAQGETTGSGGLSSFFGSNGGSLSSRPFSGLPSFGAVDTKSPSVVTALRHEVLEHVQKYLSSLGQSPIDEQDPSFAMFMWATVHNSCVSHLPHVHEDSMVSGVFYLTVPPGAGDLVLEDPRGMVPPFGNRVIHSPKVGDIVLFPSWLVHHVSPSCGTAEDQPRISLAFNIIGDWKVTSDASIQFPV